jgi:hypothetical protein
MRLFYSKIQQRDQNRNGRLDFERLNAITATIAVLDGPDTHVPIITESPKNVTKYCGKATGML